MNNRPVPHMGNAREIAIIIEFRIAPGTRALFLERLRENCEETLRDDGCLRMEVSEPVGGDGGTFYLTERWRDQAAIESHRARPGHDESHARIDELILEKKVAKCRVVNG